MAEQRTFERQWQLVRILSSRRLGATIRELAGELCIGEKTIRRDLDFFRTINIPVEETEEARGRKRFRIAEVKAAAGREFTYDEALALALAEGLLVSLAGTSFGLAAQRAVQKVRQSLDEKALKYLGKLADRVRPLPPRCGSLRDEVGRSRCDHRLPRRSPHVVQHLGGPRREGVLYRDGRFVGRAHARGKQRRAHSTRCRRRGPRPVPSAVFGSRPH